MGCVYVATNRVNGKQYVGFTIKSLESRKSGHWISMRNGSNFAFPKALRKYGFEAFDWQVVFESDDRKLLVQREIELIEQLQTFGSGYNMTIGGDGVSGVSSAMKGKQHTIIVRKKISDKLKGHKLWSGKHHTEESKIKIGLAGVGRHHTDETKKKISDGLAGIKRSDETKRKVSDSIKEWHKKRKENKV